MKIESGLTWADSKFLFMHHFGFILFLSSTMGDFAYWVLEESDYVNGKLPDKVCF